MRAWSRRTRPRKPPSENTQDRTADRGDRAVSGAVGNARQGRADRIDQPRMSRPRTCGRSSRPRASAAPRCRPPPNRPSSASAPPATMPPRRRCKSRSTTGRRPRRATAPSPRPAKAPSNCPNAPSRPRKSATSPTAKYHHFELASAAFQIGIVLASATIITGIIALAWISGLLTLAGIAFTALGIFMPHLLHLP